MKRISIGLILILMLTQLLGMSALAEDGAMTYPIDTNGEKVTLRVFRELSNSLADYVANWNDTPIFQALEEATGVHIEFIQPLESTAQEQFNLMLVSGDLPDIIIGADYYKGGMMAGVADGYYLDLAEYLPTYAPDYWSLITSKDEIYRDVANSEGIVPGFYRIVEEDGLGLSFFRLVLKQETLDKLGVAEVPKTIADWEALFDLMLADGLTPYMLAKNGYEEKFIGAFDVMNNFYKDADDKVHFGQVEPGFKEYLTLMNEWYNKGYVSKDFTSAENLDAMFATDEIGTYNKAIVAAYNSGIAQGYTVVSTPYPRQEVGQKLHWEHYGVDQVIKGFHLSNIAVSSTCKNPEIAVQWLNYVFTAEGRDLACFGIEGENFEYVNGEAVFLDKMWNYNNISEEGLNYYWRLHNASCYAYGDAVCNPNLHKSPEALAIRKIYTDDPDLDSQYYLPDGVSLTSDQQSRRTKIMNDINIYVDEMVLKFIIGTEPLDNFDTFVTTVYGMGLQEAIDITQEAYDSYADVVVPQ